MYAFALAREANKTTVLVLCSYSARFPLIVGEVTLTGDSKEVIHWFRRKLSYL
jgi:hypothetical protein